MKNQKKILFSLLLFFLFQACDSILLSKQFNSKLQEYSQNLHYIRDRLVLKLPYLKNNGECLSAANIMQGILKKTSSLDNSSSVSFKLIKNSNNKNKKLFHAIITFSLNSVLYY